MEKITQRALYSSNFFEFCQKVKLSPEFIDALKSHRYFREDMSTVSRFPDDITKKVYILLEFTRLRSTCEEVIKILRITGQTEAAQELEKYNTSPGRIEVCTEIAIKVTQAKAEMKGTLCYNMNKNPRGKCVIINNVSKEVFMESQRFESIFTQLYFNVECLESKTAQQIREYFQNLSRDRSLNRNEAFIVMIISHGQNESVLGYNACQREDPYDLIEIKEIVDTFSERNCEYLRQVPKLFFFTCCREKVNECPEPMVYEVSSLNNPIGEAQMPPAQPNVQAQYEINSNNADWRLKQLQTITSQWARENKDTFISYSCSEGYLTFFDPKLGITHFGQALSHSIAQYACEENLQSILSRTCDFMDQFVEISERSAPEMRGQCMRRQLFFNPGFYK